jgi:hypothetical protein
VRAVPEADIVETQGDPYAELSVDWGNPVRDGVQDRCVWPRPEKHTSPYYVCVLSTYTPGNITLFAMSVERGEALYGSETERQDAEGMV